jgi:hypothetical protein
MQHLSRILASLFILSITIGMQACTPAVLRRTSIEGLSYKGTDIYYQNELCARMTGLGIIKLMREKKPEWEVEVELKSPELP